MKEARLAAGISQKKLGIAAGIDEFSASARMNQYEKGKHTPDYSILKRIGNCIEYPTSYFYTEEDNLAEAILLFSKLNKAKRNSALKYLKNL